MQRSDALFSSVISGFKRLDFNDAYQHMMDSFESYSPKINTRELGSQNSVLHAMAEDKDIEAGTFARLAKKFPDNFISTEANSSDNTVVDLLIKKQKAAHLLLLEKEGMLTLSSYESNGQNALHLTASTDNPKFTNFLLNKGVDSERKNKQNLTPIDLARRYGAYANVEIFESHQVRTQKMPDDDFLDLGR